MTRTALQPTAFRGDTDIAELLDFFAPEHQFDGDARWTFGTSLRSAYVNSFEFLNHAPVVQLWRDRGRTVQAVSRLSLGTDEWFHQAAPGFRDAATTAAIIEQADAALGLLTDADRWRTVRYESDTAGIALLTEHGYEPGNRDEVFMTMPLSETESSQPSTPESVEVRELDRHDLAELRARALAQVDAFSKGAPSESELAWIHRTLPHQLAYAANQSANIVAIDRDGTCLAFADAFFDPVNLIGEFEPVGTRSSAQRQGLAAAVLVRGLGAMRTAGMTQAIVRTGTDNPAAIAAYRSVGFEVADHRISLTRQR